MKKYIYCCAAVAALLLLPLTSAQAAKILFIRGGSGTVGWIDFPTTGADEQAADITNASTSGGNHGWYQLAQLLIGNGFIVEQQIEGPASNNTPVDLASIDLTQYSVIVFGSNNANYTTAQIDAVEKYVRNGGGALFISDGNFGTSFGDAPTSDQQFLDRFGLIMNQDSGTYTVSKASGHMYFNNHPIFNNVNTFDGEGISESTIGSSIPDNCAISVLSKALANVHVNDNPTNGSSRAATANDGSLITAMVGVGRVATFFDRNTFFNTNGQGSDITKNNNAQLATNLFAWLANLGGSKPTEAWSSKDIGGASPAGSASYSNANSTFSLSAGGSDIWNAADSFRYTYLPVTGDVEIIARVNSITNTNAWAKAGVMIRATLDAGSAHATTVLTPGNGVSFQRRPTTGAASAQNSTSVPAGPVWVKVTYQAAQMTASYSLNGITWTSLGTVSMAMPTNFYVGLASTSHSDGTLCQSSLDRVGVRTSSYIGKSVILKASNGSLVNADLSYSTPGSMIANGTSVTPSEIFDIDQNTTTSIGLLNHTTGKYASARDSGAGNVEATQASIGTWEVLSLTDLGSGSLGFTAQINSKYLTVPTMTSVPLVTNSTTIGAAQTFSASVVGARNRTVTNLAP